MEENKNINDILSLITGGDEQALEAFAEILLLPDDLFKPMSEAMLVEIEKQFRNTNFRFEIQKSFQDSGIDIENLEQIKEQLTKELDELRKTNDVFPQDRIDFIERMCFLVYNSLEENTDGRKIIYIPFEKCDESAKTPTYANEKDAGADVYSIEEYDIMPGETVLVKTGIKVAIPDGYELQVRPKSGISLKTKLRVGNTPGTIDAGYRDEIGIIVENIEPPIKDITYRFNEDGEPVIESILHGRPFHIDKGQKIAQLVLCENPKATYKEVANVLSIEGDTRNGGFGSTSLF